jgi:hypothetical protein
MAYTDTTSNNEVSPPLTHHKIAAAWHLQEMWGQQWKIISNSLRPSNMAMVIGPIGEGMSYLMYFSNAPKVISLSFCPPQLAGFMEKPSIFLGF